MLTIQVIGSVALRSAGEADAPWGTHDALAGVDYTSHASVAEAVALLELDADGAYAFRVVEVASTEDSYADLQAENLDALEALDAWVEAGCPRTGETHEALRRAALHRSEAAPVNVVGKREAA